VIVWYGVAATADSMASGEMFIKAIATPVWWWLALLPATFSLLAVEFVFRMHRLTQGDRVPRDDAVSAA
jgi:TRAP-type C4-dicarboxylate transport system permease small subunit